MFTKKSFFLSISQRFICSKNCLKKKKNKLYEAQYKSFSYLIEKIIFNRLNVGPNIFKEVYTQQKKYVIYSKSIILKLYPLVQLPSI